MHSRYYIGIHEHDRICLYRSMTAADASPSPGSPSNLNSGIGPMSRSTLDPMTGAVGSNLDPMGPLGLRGVGTMGRSSERRRPGSGEVFPSDLQVLILSFFYKKYIFPISYWTFLELI